MRGPLLVACLALIASNARAQDYTVREGDTCTSIAREHIGGASAVRALHDANPQLGDAPHHLRAGQVLHLPSSVPSPDARLTRVERQVALSHASGEWRDAAAGTDLSTGDQVATRERSSAELRFRDRSVLTMRERTLLVVFGAASRTARTMTRATLESGALRTRMAELAGEGTIDTPGYAAHLGGGEAVLEVDEDGTSRLSNHGERSVIATVAGRDVDVPAGSGVVTRDGRATARELLPPPRWANDLAGRFIGLTGHGGAIRGSFSPVVGARFYRVEIAREPNGDDIVAALELPGTASEVELRRLPRGTYYLSIASIDEAGLEGRPSPRRALQVLEASVVPLDGGRPREAAFDFGDPSVEYVAPVLLPGTWIVAPRGMRCDAGSGELASMSPLRGEGSVPLRCVDIRDREVPALSIEVARVIAELERDVYATPGELLATTIRLRAPVALPERLFAYVEGGAARLTRLGEEYRLEVRAPDTATGEIVVGFAVPSGATRIPLAELRVPVRSRVAPRMGAPIRRVAPHVGDPLVQEAFAAPLFVDGSGLRAIALRGTRAGIAGTVRTDPGLARGSIGARAQLAGEPVSFALAWALDASPEVLPEARRGSGDLGLAIGFALVSTRSLALAVDLGALLPTGPEAGGLPATRALPSAGLRFDPIDVVSLRGQQGLSVDLGGGDVLSLSSLGVDLRPVPWLALGLEVDASLGAIARQTTTFLAAGLGAALRYGVVELSVGVRVPLSDDARASLGPASPSLALSFAIERENSPANSVDE